MAKKQKIRQKLLPWIEARKRHHLSHAHVQMARELGMNPKKLGSKDNHRQEPWKLPLPQFIEKLYRKTFHRDRPEDCRSIEERAAGKAQKKQVQKQHKRELPPATPAYEESWSGVWEPWPREASDSNRTASGERERILVRINQYLAEIAWEDAAANGPT